MHTYRKWHNRCRSGFSGRRPLGAGATPDAVRAHGGLIENYDRLAEQNIAIYEKRTGRSRSQAKGGLRSDEYFWHSARAARKLSEMLKDRQQQCIALPAAEQAKCLSILADNAQNQWRQHFKLLDGSTISTQQLENQILAHAAEYFRSFRDSAKPNGFAYL